MDEYEDDADFEASATSPQPDEESYNADEWEEPSPEKPSTPLPTTTCEEESTASHVIAENAVQNIPEPVLQLPEPRLLPGGDAVQIAEKLDTRPSTSTAAADDNDRSEADAVARQEDEEEEDPEYPPEMIQRFCQHPSLAVKRSTESSADAAIQLASARVKAYQQLQARQAAEAKAASEARKQAKHAWRQTYETPRSRQEYLVESTRRRKEREARAATPTPRWYARKTMPRVSTDASTEKHALAQRAQAASRRKAAAHRQYVAATLAKVAATAESARHKSCGYACEPGSYLLLQATPPCRASTSSEPVQDSTMGKCNAVAVMASAESAFACVDASVEAAAVMTRLLDAVAVVPTHPVPSTVQVQLAPTSDTECEPPSIEKVPVDETTASEPPASTPMTTEWTAESEPEPDPAMVKDACDAPVAGTKTDDARAPDPVATNV
ncbi:hypothetical protein SDRG_10645 [Saprolegnia diclina VS20]|uniref:Uncharacterized protein n=1 Tax=Saprolegnia diclina (strain VS20) TaxID=1156394 RepID=T0QB22_SAPDV|nr:hypothetical protein SDRG_10645 [Saprolegnia diclina VS20]EQC31861.1 hypothetical protein SDRG_10645 [Saprolegnia diclina VS20]|eukprot:XP_008614868.1 hypothetical protein SDRG_10645 [Saprolegnia diclina VS20]